MATTDTNTVQVTGKFDLKTILMFVSIIFGLTGIGVGGFSLTGNVPTKEVVVSSTDSLLTELRLLRLDVRTLKTLAFDVEENQDQIQAVTDSVQALRDNQEKGYNVLWEQNKLVLERLSDIDTTIENIDQ